MNTGERWKWIAAVVLVGLLGVGVGLFLASRHGSVRPAEEKKEAEGNDKGTLKLSEEQKASLGLKIGPVELRVPEDHLSVTGKVAANPDRTVVISPRTSGRVVKVLARLGDTVDAGAPMALLDSIEATEALAELTHCESGLALARAKAEKERELYEAKLRVLEAGQRQESAAGAEKALAAVELGRPKQEYISALARLELSRATYERQKLLLEKKIGAHKDLIEAEKAFIGARTEVDAVAEAIRISARQDLLSAETALQQAQSQRDKAREKVRLLGFGNMPEEKTVKPTAGQGREMSLVAPFRGTVIERQATEGQLLEAGFAAFRLADLTTVWVLLDVPETEVAKLRMGQEAIIETNYEPPLRKKARVAYIGEVVEDQSRTVKVRVELSNPERQFKPGMFVTACIHTGSGGQPVVMVPSSALFLMDGGPVVFVEEKEGFQPRFVHVGLQRDGWATIANGLKAGERIVHEGGFALKALILKSKLGGE